MSIKFKKLKGEVYPVLYIGKKYIGSPQAILNMKENYDAFLKK